MRRCVQTFDWYCMLEGGGDQQQLKKKKKCTRYFEMEHLRANVGRYELSGKHKLYKMHAVCNFLHKTVTNHF